MIVWRGEAVLLIQRGKPPFQGRWSLPGGKIEWGEPAAAAARREVFEETGVEIEVLGLIEAIDAIAEDRHFVILDYAARWIAGDPVARDDAAAAEFVDLETARARLSWDGQRPMRIIEAARAEITRDG